MLQNYSPQLKIKNLSIYNQFAHLCCFSQSVGHYQKSQNRKFVDFLCSPFSHRNMLILYCFKAGNLVVTHYWCWRGDVVIQLFMSLFKLQINNCVFFCFLADYRPIKCIHTTEDTGGVSRCVSVTEPKTSSHRVFGNQYRMGRAGGVGLSSVMVGGLWLTCYPT